MKSLFLLFLFASTLFSANILSFKVYERENRTDILFTFDTPYEGRISKKRSDHTISLHLYGAQYFQNRTRQISSKFINAFSIVPHNKKTTIELHIMPNMDVKVSKTVDSYGLRLRIEPKAAAGTQASQNPLPTLKHIQQSRTKNTLPHQSTTLVNSRYFIVMALLLVAVILLFIFKKRMEKKGGSWLFKNTPAKMEDFKILFQKSIDNQNRVVLMEYLDRQYLAIIGSSNILLDIFKDKEHVNEEGFESILKENQQELDKYLELEKSQENPKDPLQTIKEKASIEAYRTQM